MKSDKLNTILNTLANTFPDAHCELNFRNPFELLIATMLSAQTTDQKVNKVTGELFKKYPTPEKMSKLKQDEMEDIIRSIGLFRTKAKHILQSCCILNDNYNGQVPSKLDELTKLPGVGRKTADVVLANAFNIPAFPVDTHVQRVAARLGLTKEKDPLKIEKELNALIPEELWIDTHHRLIFLGRRICHARNPKCGICPLHTDCSFGSRLDPTS
ncbi:endonuclease III [Dehalobacter sp. DCM]|uniref:endonuclease III n=1 Tax=Dehalobacter sp. DCM TaxID=2907827 RepID=UPI003081F38E|nr:endonuclease III [Dehalobacter sp. DCM]